jgi:hypothetical protein
VSINLSPKVRQGIYLVVVFGTALLVPLNQAGLIPEVAMAVWTSVAGAASALAAFNVNPEA